MTQFHAGDVVEVRSKEEILRTLDKNGCLEGLPFMPQMFRFCGRRFKVYKSAHKTCDTVNGTGGRRLASGVHLDLRCDGRAQGGCQAACLIFWKEAWLKPFVAGDVSDAPALNGLTAAASTGCTEEDVLAYAQAPGQKPGEVTHYRCQATELPKFTTLLKWWDVRQYIEDYRSGNASLGRILSGLAYVSYYHGAMAWRDKVGIPSRWLYDFAQSLWGGTPFPRRKGRLPLDQAAPSAVLNLQPGELVRVKSYGEILATLDTKTNHRGLKWDAELVPYCGGTYRVKARVDRFLDEKTGRLMSLKTPAVVLENVWCQARYSECRMFCPRSIYSWWREVWLERANPAAVPDAEGCKAHRATAEAEKQEA